MKNLMSRDEYIRSVNEGIIGDTFKKGIEKVKSFFNIGMRKIKGMITVFTNSGKILPVVTPQAMIDRVSGISGVEVCTTKDVNASIIDAGGKPCPENMPLDTSDEIYDFGPDGDAYFDWIENKEYENTLEYKNFMSISKIVEESNKRYADGENLFEDVDYSKRISYTKDSLRLENGDTNFFKERIKKLYADKINGEAVPNLLVFGAPGIGKSTIPNAVVREFNKNVSASDKMSIIKISAPNIQSGDLLMPTAPKEKDIKTMMELNPEMFKALNPEVYGNIAIGKVKGVVFNAGDDRNLVQKQVNNKARAIFSDEFKKRLDAVLAGTPQYTEVFAPQTWFPCYRKTGDDAVDKLLDRCANFGVFTDEDNTTMKTGGGGIILIDELLRAKPDIFQQFMDILMDRRLSDWEFGSKWIIVACSNRPCDSIQIDKVWNTNIDNAFNERFVKSFRLIPDPVSWKKWALGKGYDPVIMEYIFDEKSKIGDEYPRWHSMFDDPSYVKNNSPRTWEWVFLEIHKSLKRHNIENGTILDLTDEQIKFDICDMLDPDVVSDFLDWIKERRNRKFNLADYIDDDDADKFTGIFGDQYNDGSQSVKESVGDSEVYKNRLTDIVQQMHDMFGDHMEKATPRQLRNVTALVCSNFKHDLYLVKNNYIMPIWESGDLSVNAETYEREGKTYIKDYKLGEASAVICAAFPEDPTGKNDFGEFKNLDEETKFLVDRGFYSKDGYEIWKDYLKRFGNYLGEKDGVTKVKYYNDLH